MRKDRKKGLIALLTNHDDDVYCFRRELIEGLVNEGYDMLISCPYGEKFELMSDISYIYDDPVIDRRGTNVIADLKLLGHYIILFGKYRPDAVLTYTAKPNVYAGMAAHIFGIPVISNVTGLGSVLKEDGLKQKFILNLFKFAYRQSACIMFQNSENMKLAVRGGMVTGKREGRFSLFSSLMYGAAGGSRPKKGKDYMLIPGSGVNTVRFKKLPYPEGGDGISGEKVVFNYIGRILKDKGVDDYIEAAKRIHSEFPQTEFNMIGFIEPTESHYEDDLKKLEKEGVVFYRGQQKDVRPFIERAHAIIHPSTYGEGMSNVLLENASSGRPVITTDNPGCRETVNDGLSGYIYPGGDTDALCDSIRMFLKLPNEKRKRMGDSGRLRMERNFSRDKVVKAYSDMLAYILKNKEEVKDA